MVFIEKMLENKANPAMLLAWMGLLPGFKNKCAHLPAPIFAR